MAGMQRQSAGATRRIGEPHEWGVERMGESHERREAWLMSWTDELPLELWIEPGSDPITGWLSQPGRGRQRLGGWVELTAAIESARRELAGAGRGGADQG